MFLRILQNLQENTCVIPVLHTYINTCLKIQHRCFRVNFAKFLKRSHIINVDTQIFDTWYSIIFPYEGRGFFQRTLNALLPFARIVRSTGATGTTK